MIKPKVPCPFCGHRLSRVIDSQGDGPRSSRQAQLAWPGGIWRLRVCDQCQRRFTTEEVVRVQNHQP